MPQEANNDQKTPPKCNIDTETDTIFKGRYIFQGLSFLVFMLDDF